MYSLEAAYGQAFFVENQREGLLHAGWFCPLLVDVFHPGSVVDVGCGTGHFVQWFDKHGVKATGIEGSQWAVDHTIGRFVFQADLRKPYVTTSISPHYDLAISIEVAEHLEPEYAGVFVDTLCALSDTVVLSAAVPGQGGEHHVNEREPEYWILHFIDRGYYYDKRATAELLAGILAAKVNKYHVAGWFKNIMVFRKRAS